MKENEAFRFIQKTAMRERKTMREIAQAVIDGTLRPTGHLGQLSRRATGTGAGPGRSR